MKKGRHFKKFLSMLLVLSLIISNLVVSDSYAFDEYQTEIEKSENYDVKTVAEDVYAESPLEFVRMNVQTTKVKYGDINGDSYCDSVDLALLKSYLLGKRKSFDGIAPSGYDSLKAADVNGDGEINSIDYALMKRYILGLIREFPAENNEPEPEEPEVPENPEEPEEPEYVQVTGINIEDKALKLNVGDSTTISATVLPTNASNKEIKWSSDNDEIVIVNQSGTVTAVKDGTANIIAETVEGGFKTYCNVIVSQPASGMTLDKSTYSMKTGESIKLNAIFTPENTTNKKIKWSSSNSDVASVGQGGVVTAFSEGTAIITAEAEDGGYTSSCTIIVTQKTFGVRLSERVITINAGEKKELKALYLPENAGNKKIKWSSSDESIAKVSESGVVTAVKAGEAYINVEPEEGIYSDSCKVIVIQPVKGISLDKSSLNLKVGFGYSLKVEFTPSDATERNVKWTSSNEKVAKVNEKGSVVALSAGTATITATSESGGFTAKCTVTVVPEAMSAPVITGERTSSGVKLSWNAVSGAKSYTIKRGEYIGDLVDIKTDYTQTSFTDATAESDTTYYYVVCANSDSGISRNSNLLIIKSEPKAPKLFGIKSAGNARLSWTNANGADRYEIYRSTTKGGQYTLLSKNLLSHSYEDKNIGGETYYYVVKAINEKGESEYSNEVEINDSAVKPLDFISNEDSDGDGISNIDELLYCTNPTQTDTDGDGLSDGYEIILGTDPLSPDTDKDGLYDGAEVLLGTGPLVANSNVSEITSKRQAISRDGRISVDVLGDGNFIIAPLQIFTSENPKFKDINGNYISGIAGEPIDIEAGGFVIIKADITCNYDKTNLNGISESDLGILYFNNSTNQFATISGSPDTANSIIKGQTEVLGSFVIGNRSLAPSSQPVDIIMFIDESAQAKSNDPASIREIAAYVLGQYLTSNPSFENYVRVGILIYDDSISLNVANGDFMVEEVIVDGGSEFTGDAGTIMQRLDYVLSNDLYARRNSGYPLPPRPGDVPSKGSILDRYFSSATNKKIIIGFSSGPLNRFNYITQAVRDLAPKGFVVDTVAVGANAQYNQLAIIAQNGAVPGKSFWINQNNNMTEDELISQLSDMCAQLSEQLALQSYVEGTYRPQNSVNIEFSDEYKGMENSYSNEWITGSGTNLLTGSYMETHKDIQIQSNGYDIVFERTYNSNSNKEDSIVGKGFRTNFDAKLEEKVSSAKVTASLLNVRSGPSTNHSIIGKVSKGTNLEILENGAGGSGWHKINYNGNTNAYVSATYVDEISTIEITYPTGTKVSFEVKGDGSYKAPFWSNDTLEKQGNEYIVTI